MEEARIQLLEYLDRIAFAPIFAAPSEGMSDDEIKDLEDAQRAARDTRERYGACKSSVELRDAFERDLSDPSRTRALNRRLERLGLPTLFEAKAGFEELYEELEAAGSAT